MIVKNGEIIAINSVKTDNTLTGDGVRQVLGLNTTAVIDPIKADISAVSSKISEISADIVTIHNDITNIYSGMDVMRDDINDVSGEISGIKSDITNIYNNIDVISGDINNIYNNISTISGEIVDINLDIDHIYNNIDTISGDIIGIHDDISVLSASATLIAEALLDETEERMEADDYLSAAIDRKMENIYPGENIAIDDDVISVSGTKDFELHYPIFGIETSAGLIIGLHDTTKQFNYGFDTTAIETPLTDQRYTTDGFKIKNNELYVDEKIRKFSIDVSYMPDGEWHPDFLYETQLIVTDKDNNTVYTDYQSLGNKHSNSFGLNLNNNSPYTFIFSGDIDHISGMSMNISCMGTWMPNYDYLDAKESEATTGRQILVWNPAVLGTGEEEDIVGIDDDTALGV